MGKGRRKKKLRDRAHKKSVYLVRSTDTVIPIVFPDYKISTPIGRVSDLGHAGVLFINGSNGRTKYYEYGRYDKENLGIVRRRVIPDVITGKDGRPIEESLAKTLNRISKKAGHGGRIEAVYIEVGKGYKKMLKFVEDRRKQNNNKKRKPYSILTNNCMTFAIETVEAAESKLKLPIMIDPRPNSYIDELSDVFPKLDYYSKNKKLYIQEVYEFVNW